MQRPIRILFLCTGNSARSQIAEALLTRQAGGRLIAGSAGSLPAPVVNPLAIVVLDEHGIEWYGRRPKSIDDVIGEPWDIVITVCDNARDACPVFPGGAVPVHWGLPDPAEVTGTTAEKLQAFRETADELSRRIDLLVALPLEVMEPRDIADTLRSIAESATRARRR